MQLALILPAVISLLSATAAAQTCFSLAGSAACVAWSNYSVSSTLGSFTDVASFDAFVMAQADTASSSLMSFSTNFDCPNYNGNSLQYHVTTLCGMAVDISSRDAGCNPAGDLFNTCQSSANAFLNSVIATFADGNQCNQSPSADVLARRNDLIQQATTFLSRLANEGAVETCIQADLNTPEDLNCGFYQNKPALSYCKSNPTSDCCLKVAGFAVTNGTSTSASNGGNGGNGGTGMSATSSSATATLAGAKPAASTTTDPNATMGATAAPADAGGGMSTGFLSMKILGLSMPIFLGIVGGALVVLIGIIVAVCVCSKRSKSRSGMQGERGEEALLSNAGKMGMKRNSDDVFRSGGSSPKVSPETQARALAQLRDPDQAETMEVVFNYVPGMEDEVYLCVGDPVLVRVKFDDGWGYGVNLATQMEGTFPLACLAAISPARLRELREEEQGGRGNATERDTWTDGAGRNMDRQSFNVGTRVSSMLGPNSYGNYGQEGDYGRQSQYSTSQYSELLSVNDDARPPMPKVPPPRMR
ncbi:hypothetical protein DFJ73DRAFT_831304 [Zopfochytrium polystomum]|nr:hypothetical protein DFJ73DRAFT_831304 [Zopfochytrium polystomum]